MMQTKVTAATPKPNGGVDITIEDAAGGNARKVSENSNHFTEESISF